MLSGQPGLNTTSEADLQLWEPNAAGAAPSSCFRDLLNRFGTEIGARPLEAAAVRDVGRRLFEACARSVGIDAKGTSRAFVARQMQLAQHTDETAGHAPAPRIAAAPF